MSRVSHPISRGGFYDWEYFKTVMKIELFSLITAACFLSSVAGSSPLSQSQEVSLSSLYDHFTTGLEVPASGLEDIDKCLGNVTTSSESYLQSWTYYTSTDPAMTNHQATLNFTYGLELTGHVITHFLNAYLSGYNSLTSFSSRFTNYEHMMLSLNSTFYTYLLNVTASQISIVVNAQHSLWNTVTKEVGKLLKIVFLSQAVSYTAPAALMTENQPPQNKELFHSDPLRLKNQNEAAASERRQNYEQLKALALGGFSTDYYYYPVERDTFTDTDRVNLYKHFLFYANLLQEQSELLTCPVAYAAFTTPFSTSMGHFGNAGTSTDSLVNGLYTLAESFSYIYEAYSTCYVLGNTQYVSLSGIVSDIGGNGLYWLTNLQNRRVEIANLSTAFYPCIRMGDWECVARVSGQIVSLLFTTVSA